jgi:hypothetical protein
VTPPSFEFLQDRVLDIFHRWRTWKRLFLGQDQDAGEAKVRLLNKSAATFFSVVHDILLDDVVLRLWKLTDRDEKKTLTFRTLIKTNPFSLPPGELAKAKAVFDRYLKTTTTAEEWRQNKIAHENRARALGTKPLGKLKMSDIDKAISEAIEFMRAISQDSGFLYEEVSENGGPDQLFTRLIWAERYHKEKRKAAPSAIYDRTEFKALGVG